MVAHLCGESNVPGHDVPDSSFTPERIKAIRRKVAALTKEFERLFGIPARTMEPYQEGRHRLDGATQALRRIIEREPEAERRALAA
jgi:putative transcriptional regulator